MDVEITAERKVKEALYIRLTPPGLRMNRDEGKDPSPLWLNDIKTIKRTLPK